MKPDILFVILDDLGIVDVTEVVMPTLWDFGAGGGARSFAHTYSMPICSQSRACMLYGKYGRNLGIIEGMSPYNGPEPAPDTDTVATLLSDAGYNTALIGKWHLGRDPENPTAQYIGAPEARGFDSWLAGSPENLDDFFSWLRVDDFTQGNETTYATLAQVQAAEAWWADTASPKFMQVSFNTPHGPYHFPPADELGGFVSTAQSLNRRKYEAECRSADWAFGRLLDLVGPNTVVVVVGDNGTPANATTPAQDHNRVKSTCYEGGIRVPLAMRSPSYPPGITNRLVHIVDIPATILWFAGVTIPSDWDGRSLSTTPRSSCISEATLGLAENFDLVHAAMTSRYKLLRRNLDPEELYDLQTDPKELTKLSLTDPANSAILDELRTLLYG